MKRVEIHEVAPRDGLQNESVILDTADKVQFIRLLADSGVDSIEITSFVRPDRVPQLADADQLCARLEAESWYRRARADGLRIAGLVANDAGMDRLLAADLDIATLLVSATEGHSRANVGMGVAQAHATALRLIQRAREAQVAVRAYVSTAFVCPVEGPTDPVRVVDLATSFVEAGAQRLVLADTLGAATPSQCGSLLDQVLAVIPSDKVGMHMHDTHGRALACCRVGWDAGVRSFDAAAAGTGGCPFAPGAAGNLDTRSLRQLAPECAERLDPNALDRVEAFLRDRLGHGALSPLR